MNAEFDDDFVESAGFPPAEVEVGIDGFETFQHTQSGTIHYREDINPVRLMCARVFTSTYARIKDKLKYSWPICQQCKSKMALAQNPA
jgi:hypothetical protein